MPPLTDLAAIGLLPALLIGATAWLMPAGRARHVPGRIALALALAFIPAPLPAPWHVPGLALATAALIRWRAAPRGWPAAAALTTLAFALPMLLGCRADWASLAGDRLPWWTCRR